VGKRGKGRKREKGNDGKGREKNTLPRK